MKEKRIMWSVCLILLISNVFIFFYMKKEQSDLIREQSESDKFLESQFSVLMGNTGLQYESENFYFEDCEIKQDSGEAVAWENLIKDKSKLIFRYTENHCNSCVEHCLNMLSVYKKYIGDGNIIILATGKNLARLRIYLKKYEIDMPVVYTSGKVDLPIEEYNTPYFYVMNNDKKIKLVFLPIKEIPDRTKKYLDIIGMRFMDETL